MTDSESPRLAVLLAKLSKTVYRKSEEALPGLSIKDYLALTNLDERGVPQQRLAECLGMDENNLVLLLNGLEEAGSIARQRDPDDRRRHIVEITLRGKKILERAERGMDKLEQELLSVLSPLERAALKQLVRRVLESQAASARQPEVARPRRGLSGDIERGPGPGAVHRCQPTRRGLSDLDLAAASATVQVPVRMEGAAQERLRRARAAGPHRLLRR